MPVFSDGQKINQADVWNRLIQSIPASYVVWKDGTTYRAECLLKDGTDYSGSDLATVIQNAIDASISVEGTVHVRAMQADITKKITVSPYVHLYFEKGGTFNITFGGDAFYGKGSASRCDFNLYFGACFKLYDYITPTVFLHLTNTMYSNIFIRSVYSGAATFLAGTKVVRLDNDDVNVGAYYNKIQILYAEKIETVVDLPYSLAGANANYIEYLCVSAVKYGVKIAQNVGDNHITEIVVTGGGILAAGAAVYIDGVANHIVTLYGEYATGAYGGPLLYLDTHALGNVAKFILQEGSGGLVTNNSTLKNDIGGKVGYVTEWSGYTTGTDAQQTIAHGCSFTPTGSEVFLSERTTGGALARQTAVPNATYIYITATSAKDYNWKVERA